MSGALMHEGATRVANSPTTGIPNDTSPDIPASAIPAPGFADPVGDAQRIFRATIDALSRPTLPQTTTAGVTPPAPLSPMAGAVVLTLCDEQTPVWVDRALRFTGEVEAWIRFHTAAPLVDDPADAVFCVASCPSEIPALADLRQGTDEEPHRSATVIVDAAGARPVGAFVATGPGVKGEATWDGAGLPPTRAEAFVREWTENTRRFPRGVDLILAFDREIRGIPRTTTITARTAMPSTTPTRPGTTTPGEVR